MNCRQKTKKSILIFSWFSYVDAFSYYFSQFRALMHHDFWPKALVFKRKRRSVQIFDGCAQKNCPVLAAFILNEEKLEKNEVAWKNRDKSAKRCGQSLDPFFLSRMCPKAQKVAFTSAAAALKLRCVAPHYGMSQFSYCGKLQFWMLKTRDIKESYSHEPFIYYMNFQRWLGHLD